MEIDSRFWKIHKKSWKLKGILLRNSAVCFFHPAFQYKDMHVYVLRSNFGVFHIFLYCDWNLVRGSQRQNQRELVALVHEGCKRSLIFKALVMEKILKFRGYTQ